MMTSAAVGVELLDRIVAQACTGPGLHWLMDRCAALQAGAPAAQVAMAFSAAPRRAPARQAEAKALATELRAAFTQHFGFAIDAWTHAERVRIRLLLALPSEDAARLTGQLEQLHEYGDLGEHVALYKALSCLPHPQAHRDRAALGLRSNMRALFDAVALDNPYPAAHLGEAAFNQLVLKALFVGAPLHRVIGLDGRANPELSRMLVDYAAERRAASRRVPVELWRPLALAAEGAAVVVLRSALRDEDRLTRLAAALACQAAEATRALLQDEPGLAVELSTGPWDYPTLVQEASRQL